MRRLISLPVFGLGAALAGCGSSSTSTPVTAPLTYSIGGSITDLSGTILLQNNGGDNLSVSSNGAFTFNVPLQPDAAYHVTIATQPTNQVCTLSNGSGKATASVTNITILCSLNSNATDLWTWISGSDFVNAPGVYGTKGTAAASDTPGARRQSIAWTDTSGNFWLFGGATVGNALLNDLWEYNPAAKQWVWQSGSDTVGAAASYGAPGTPAASNNPGAREGAARWADATGNLWLFGGDSLAGANAVDFNDLWEYSIASAQWTWVGGSNIAGNTGSYGTLGLPAAGNLPPARTDSINWVDSAGVFWLFGGAQFNPNGSLLAVLNDLWSYNPTSGLWTWVGGSNTRNAAGVFGAQGTAAAGNVPGARQGGNTWLDASGNTWLFGGEGLSPGGVSQEYNDLWEYNPVSGEWTWVAGADVPNTPSAYGTQGAGAAGNSPGARATAVSWTDSAGNFWLFGGYGYGQVGELGDLNDLWEYDLATGVWTWIGGSTSTAAYGTYGTQGIPASTNVPGAREQAVGWLDTSGDFWLFGGLGFDASNVQGNLNDLWDFTQRP